MPFPNGMEKNERKREQENRDDDAKVKEKRSKGTTGPTLALMAVHMTHNVFLVRNVRLH